MTSAERCCVVLKIVSKDPEADSERLIRDFMKRAIRRPIQSEEILPFIKLARDARRDIYRFLARHLNPPRPARGGP